MSRNQRCQACVSKQTACVDEGFVARSLFPNSLSSDDTYGLRYELTRLPVVPGSYHLKHEPSSTIEELRKNLQVQNCGMINDNYITGEPTYTIFLKNTYIIN